MIQGLWVILWKDDCKGLYGPCNNATPQADVLQVITEYLLLSPKSNIFKTFCKCSSCYTTKITFHIKITSQLSPFVSLLFLSDIFEEGSALSYPDRPLV